MKKSNIIFIGCMLILNLMFGKRTKTPKGYYEYYYYPKYSIYHETNSGKWYYQSGCTWVVTESFPKNYSLLKVKFSKKQIVRSKQTLPISYYSCNSNKKTSLIKYKKLHFTINTHWHSSKNKLKVKSKTTYS